MQANEQVIEVYLGR
ncbi:hypothetical protein AB9D48_28040 [Klebsiella quasipneumoniae]